MAKAKKLKQGSPRNRVNLAKKIKQISQTEETLKKLKADYETRKHV